MPSCELPLIHLQSGTEFDCGSGLTDSLRADYEPAVGAIVVYAFQELSKDGVPRCVR